MNARITSKTRDFQLLEVPGLVLCDEQRDSKLPGESAAFARLRRGREDRVFELVVERPFHQECDGSGLARLFG